MNKKAALFVLINAIFIFMLTSTLLLIIRAYIDIGDLMMLVLMFPACLVFAVLGIFLLRLSKSVPIILLNKWLPLISIPALILSTGFANSSRELLAGILVDTILILLALFTTTITLLRHRRNTATEVQKE